MNIIDAAQSFILSLNSPSIGKRRPKKAKPILERFEALYIPEPTSGCWLWLGSVDRRGYGYFKVKPKTAKAHRFSYEFHNSEIPLGMFVCHRCDVPGCVNPDHLFLGTALDNAQDRNTKGRQMKGVKSHSAKISDNNVIDIRADSRHVSEIAIQYGVSETQIYRIKNQSRWKHI